MLLLLGPNVAVLGRPTPDAVVARVLGELSSLVGLGVTRFAVRWGAREGLLDLTCCDVPAHEQGPVERVACRKQCLGDGTTRSDRGQAPGVGPPRQMPCRSVAAACRWSQPSVRSARAAFHVAQHLSGAGEAFAGRLGEQARGSRQAFAQTPSAKRLGVSRRLLIGLAVELQPAGRVLTTGVVMRPMNDAAL
jgi:hypothetical protein